MSNKKTIIFNSIIATLSVLGTLVIIGIIIFAGFKIKEYYELKKSEEIAIEKEKEIEENNRQCDEKSQIAIKSIESGFNNNLNDLGNKQIKTNISFIESETKEENNKRIKKYIYSDDDIIIELETQVDKTNTQLKEINFNASGIFQDSNTELVNFCYQILAASVSYVDYLLTDTANLDNFKEIINNMKSETVGDCILKYSTNYNNTYYNVKVNTDLIFDTIDAKDNSLVSNWNITIK